MKSLIWIGVVLFLVSGCGLVSSPIRNPTPGGDGQVVLVSVNGLGGIMMDGSLPDQRPGDSLDLVLGAGALCDGSAFQFTISSATSGFSLTLLPDQGESRGCSVRAILRIANTVPVGEHRISFDGAVKSTGERLMSRPVRLRVIP